MVLAWPLQLAGCLDPAEIHEPIIARHIAESQEWDAPSLGEESAQGQLIVAFFLYSLLLVGVYE